MTPRQIFLVTGLIVIASAVGCVTSHEEQEGRGVRFSIPDGATRVVVLGTAAPEAAEAVPDPIGRPRAAAALALWSAAPDRLVLVDTPPGTVDRLTTLDLPEGFGDGAAESFDTVLWTQASAANRAGLRELLDRLDPGLTLNVLGPAGTAAAVASLPADRVEVRELGDGETAALAPRLRATALRTDLGGDTAIGFGLEGAGRGLLYFPRLGALRRPLADLARPAAICLLDGRRWETDPAGLSIPEQLRALDGLPSIGRTLQFTAVAPGNPAIRPTSRAARQLDETGASLALDGQEWWL